MALLHVGDEGIKIVLDVKTSISTSTAWLIHYRKPDKTTTGSWTAVKESSTSISYTLAAGGADLDTAGNWELQAYVEDTWKAYGVITHMTVEEALA